jgi:hypothetical protein
MRMLKKVTLKDDYLLVCRFDNGIEKWADIKPYLHSEAFAPLQKMSVFYAVQNNAYYVSWLNEAVDLSADTLWHIGVETA